MVETDLGMVMLVNSLQSANAYLPIKVTLDGIVALVMLHLRNALSPTDVTVLGIFRFFISSPFNIK